MSNKSDYYEYDELITNEVERSYKEIKPTNIFQESIVEKIIRGFFVVFIIMAFSIPTLYIAYKFFFT